MWLGKPVFKMLIFKSQEFFSVFEIVFLLAVVSVCRVMGRQALSQGRLGAAIWWGVRSKDAAFTSHLAHQVGDPFMVLSFVCVSYF